MNQIYSATEQDPLERFQRDSKKIADKATAATAVKSFHQPAHDNDSSPSLFTAQNRLALRNDYTYQGLLATRALFEKEMAPQEKEERLLAHIRETRFLDEPVLEEWQPNLLKIFRTNDARAFDSLLATTAERFKPATKDEIILENIAALSSQKPNDLLKEVIRGIKAGSLPDVGVERQRVLDLLK